jgi:hypothetical protein
MLRGEIHTRTRSDVGNVLFVQPAMGVPLQYGPLLDWTL